MKVPDEDVSDEAHVCRKIPTPTTPSREEVDEHNLLGHVQYRSWCAVCVASRGVGQRHTAVEDQPSAKPMILSDYAFMNGGETKEAKAAQEAAGSMPILVVKDKRTKTLAASFVPEKGCETFAVKWFGAFLLRMGHAEVVNKSDGEPAIKALKQKAAEEVGVVSIPEESAPYD